MAGTFSAAGKRLGRPPKPQGAPSSNIPVGVAKAMQQFKAFYDAAKQGRRMAGWNPPTSGPNRAMAGLQTIRNRSRDASRNDWAGESTIQKWATALIGHGITPRFKRLKNATRKQIITDLWEDFVAVADADCVLDLYGQQTLVSRSWLEAGEVFARRRPRFLDEDLPVPLQIQILEADMVPLFDADTYQGLPTNNIIRSGIEFDNRGKRIAYWVYKQHPGDNPSTFQLDQDLLVRVAASDMVHIFEQKRPGQIRGVSVLAPILPRLRNIGDYEDATLERQKIANMWVGFISRTVPAFDPTDPNVNEWVSGQLDGLLDDGGGVGPQPLIPVAPGLMQELEDGQSINWSNPPEAGTTYSDYMRTSHLGSAAASGLPYELYSGDIINVSDRTLRVIINDFRRFAEQRQWQIIIPMFCKKVVSWFADAGVLNGSISVEEAALVKRAEHAPHGWAYIHPVQDVQGKALGVLNGFESRSSVIGARGDDPEQVDAERAADQEREIKLGLAMDPTAMPNPNTPDQTHSGTTQNDNQQQQDQNQQANAAADLEIKLATLRRIEAETDKLRAVAQADPLAEQRAKTMAAIVDLLGDDDDAGE